MERINEKEIDKQMLDDIKSIYNRFTDIRHGYYKKMDRYEGLSENEVKVMKEKWRRILNYMKAKFKERYNEEYF